MAAKVNAQSILEGGNCSPRYLSGQMFHQGGPVNSSR